MAKTVNITRHLRDGNETGLSGAEAISVENVGAPDQTISLGTEEQTALGAFKDHQLQAMSLLCDQDAEAQFLGVRYAILDTVAGPPGTITHTGDLTQEIFAGDLVRLEDMPAAGDNGIYLVATCIEAAGTTTITLENGQDIPTAGGGAFGTVARVCSKQLLGYSYPVLALVAATGAITITGDVTDKFAAGEALLLQETVANDGYWIISSVTEAAGVTTIIVLDSAGVPGLVANAGAVGTFVKVRPGILLTANVAFLWSIESGIQNPFVHPDLLPGYPPVYSAVRGDVAYCMVNNPGTVNAEFKARICTNAIIF